MNVLEPLMKLWPLIMGVGALIVLIVKIVIKQGSMSIDVDNFKQIIPKLALVPDRLDRIEQKMERMTPRIAEVRRLRMDFDALDDDVSEVRDAMMRGHRPGPRARRYRTPATGVPVVTRSEDSDDTDNNQG